MIVGTIETVYIVDTQILEYGFFLLRSKLLGFFSKVSNISDPVNFVLSWLDLTTSMSTLSFLLFSK